MADPLRNFFKSQLIGEYSNTATSFTISTGDGALLPDPSVDGEYNLVIFEGTAGSSADEFEVVRVTAKSSDTLTVTRGQEGTTPITVTSAFHSIIMAATKKTFDDINTAIDNVDLTSLTGVEELTFDTTGDEEFGLPAGTTAQRPASPSAGYMRWNSTDSRIEFYNGSRWAGLSEIGLEQVSLGVAQLSVTANDALFEAVATFLGNRGLFGGGNTGSRVNTIDFIAIDTTGNATDFGDLTQAKRATGSCSNGTRGLFAGGDDNSSVDLNEIEYVTIATTGNATDFGDLTQARRGNAGCSSVTRGLFGSGFVSSIINVIDYVTIDTTGNAIDFGDLSVSRDGIGACSNGTRALFGGGYDGSSVLNTIDYVTIDTTGNAQDFGDLTQARRIAISCSDGSRGLFAEGLTSTEVNTIDYVTIDTTGNATDFGDLTIAKRGGATSSNGTRAVFGGGFDGSNRLNTIDFVTVQTTGNATDFGDLTSARDGASSCSGD